MKILKAFSKQYLQMMGIQVSLTSLLIKNKKVEHHIRMQTHKVNVLRFWVKMASIPYVG